jgi:hypothetical protein
MPTQILGHSPRDVEPELWPWKGRGRPPVARYHAKPSSLRELALAAGAEQAVAVTWRQGSRGPMTSRFLALRVRPANVKLRRMAANTQTELPVHWLLAEWPADAAEPTDYWLSSLPSDTPLGELVRLGKLRWRIEHDYRELKDARARPLRRSLLPRLAPPRHARLGRARFSHPRTPAPETQGGSLSLFALLRELQPLIAFWTGHCPTCRRRLPPPHHCADHPDLTEQY